MTNPARLWIKHPLCGDHRADRVPAGGRWVVEDGAIPRLDVAALTARHNQAASVRVAG